MKAHLSLLLIFTSLTYAQQKGTLSTIVLPAKQKMHLEYPLLENYTIRIKNKSKFELGVTQFTREKDSLLQKHEIDKEDSIDITLQKGEYLQFENRFLVALTFEISINIGIGGTKKRTPPLSAQRSFYLENNTAQTLYLQIPGVMNPTLAPFSRSGVDLPNGQPIFARVNGENLLIFTVTDSLQHGTRIDLATLINSAINRK